ncbi:MAG: sulfatase [Planctomycetota bacterium]
MIRVNAMLVSASVIGAMMIASVPRFAVAAPPNIVWIIADDLGPELGCYGYGDVATPNLDRLAASGRMYTQAFSTAPVCSASRTAFQTGRYQTTIGGHHHNTRDKRELPGSVSPVTELMREAGYFVCNGRGVADDLRTAKSHFNFVYQDSTFFDGHDWSQREPGQPFFAQVQIKEPHRAHVPSKRPRPDAVIPPYYPDHAVTRADWANYLASIEVLDRKVGAVMNRLEAEGERENTLVLFFGDHGRPHVRGKQWLYDGGIHTPFIASWPSCLDGGGVESGLVSLLDAMPTTLAAAGVAIPDGLVGMDLLADVWEGHEQVFSARDRCGDAADRIRAVRTADLKYIRNYQTDVPYMQHSGYKKLAYPVATLMKVLHADGKFDSPFMASTRPREELYDLTEDPHELTNLAEDPRYAEQLAKLRHAVEQWVIDTGDRGEIDESETVDMHAVMLEKRNYYERAMRKRGLDPEIADRDYLAWWVEQLGIE